MNIESSTNQPVSIRIKSQQSEKGYTPTKIEQFTDGTLSRTGNEWTVVYKESHESGYDDTYTTVIIKEDGSVQIDRQGNNQMKMEFIQGKKHLSRMETPYGTIDLGVLTNKVKVNLNEKGGDILLSYSINMNNNFPVETRMRMFITAK